MKIKSEALKKQVQELDNIQKWNHNFMLPSGIETRPEKQFSHGKNLVKLNRLKPLFNLIDLGGKKVLDVGCNEGFFSLEMASSGAKVMGIDVDEKRILKANFIKQLLGNNLSLNFDLQDIYSKEFAPGKI